jgi:hypothetical protein
VYQVTATSMEGLLVSTNLSGCGFVYGSLSFLDKLACGVALYWIEGMNGKETLLQYSSTSTAPSQLYFSFLFLFKLLMV